MKSVKLEIKGMSCGHCVNSVEGAVKTLGAKGKVDLAANTATIEYDENQTSLEAIKEAIEEQGYTVV